MPTIDELRGALAAREQAAPPPERFLAAVGSTRQSRRHPVLAAALVIVLVLVAAGIWAVRDSGRTPAASGPYTFTGATTPGTLIPVDRRHKLGSQAASRVFPTIAQLTRRGQSVVSVLILNGRLCLACSQPPTFKVAPSIIGTLSPPNFFAGQIMTFAMSGRTLSMPVDSPDASVVLHATSVPADGRLVVVLFDRHLRVAAVYLGPITTAQVLHAVDQLNREP